MSIAVVGAGVIGLSTAVQIQRSEPRAKVVGVSTTNCFRIEPPVFHKYTYSTYLLIVQPFISIWISIGYIGGRPVHAWYVEWFDRWNLATLSTEWNAWGID